MQAIILAGGLGQRLRATLPHLPKPMAPIQHKPFLAHLLDYLKQQGVRHVVLAVHYLRECIYNYFQHQYHNITIAYANEEEPLGTGGAIVYAMTLLNGDEPVFVLNGDTFVKFNYHALYQQHVHHQAAITMGLRQVDHCERYGKVIVKNHIVTAFKEKGEIGPGLINAGVYLMNPDLFAQVTLPKQFSFEHDFLHPYVHNIKPQAFITEDYFIDIGIPEDYARAQAEMKLFICEND
ncbi:MAG: hypothetical protein A3F42_00210 [Gammaproteobacteria bacterium RIFCSPHIGHO2_12_FULL_37_34]|nr:MAG: hypothetical protein A3F42_00210 [Gammaproteobacteria bacterium RIFCSPHIGHO2_12_FULL_37_34]